MKSLSRTLALAAGFWAGLACAGPRDLTVRLIGFNDFHGHLIPEVSAAGSRGGILAFAERLNALRAEVPYHAVVSAGDLFGASPLAVSLLADEPTINLMNQLKPDFNVLGNHEFDGGQAELARKMHGGCQQYLAAKPCQLGPFGGAHFPMLSANIVKKDGSQAFTPYLVKRFGPLKIAFIGATTTDTPGITKTGNTDGLTFQPEAEAINRWARHLSKTISPDLIVAVMHEGGYVEADDHSATCSSMTGRLPAILDALDPTVKIVVSGHTHRLYQCERGGRLITSAESYSHYLTRIDLKFDRTHRKLLNWQVRQEPVSGDGAGAPTKLQTDYFQALQLTLQQVSRPVAPLAASVSNKSDQPDEVGEIPLGRWVADAYVTSLKDQGADIALTNPGGLREPLTPENGMLSYGQLMSVLPFMNRVVLLEMSGREIEALLAEQFNREKIKLLPVSARLSYRYRKNGVEPGSIRIGGAPLVPERRYRVATNDFLYGGGDAFKGFKLAKKIADGPLDSEALEAWLKSTPPVDNTPRLIKLY